MVRFAWPALAVVACAPRADVALREPGPIATATSPGAVAGSESVVAEPPSRQAGGPSRPGLSPGAARRYMVELINRDRASMGLAPVVLDDGAATKAGQRHAEDMARSGFLGHWGTDGSVPEQRFSEAGGVDMVLENASCFTDEKTRKLDRAPQIEPKNVELAESMFFHEQPPHDGHRRNILKPWHRRVGIGVAQPVATATEIPAPCFAQEFIDPYGTYAPIPPTMRAGQPLRVEGTIRAPAAFAGVGLSRVDAPAPLSVSEVNRRRSYPVPTPFVMYWPPGYQTPIPVRISGNRFSVEVPLTDAGKPGMYELSVWATMPGAEELVMVGLRTIQAAAAR